MNCSAIEELLPWLLNGTLGEEERRRVRDHLATCADCRARLTATQRACEVFDGHLSAPDLVALAYGEPPGGVDPELAHAHLAECPQCAAELELARTSRRLEEDDRVALFPGARRPAQTPAPPPAAAPRWRAGALAAGLAGVAALGGWWQSAERANDLADQLAARPARSIARPAPMPWPSPRPQPAPSPGEAERLAQMEAEVQQLTGTVKELRDRESALARTAEARPAPAGPQINTWSHDLRPSAGVVRGSAGPALEVPVTTTTATLFLAGAPEETHGDHAIEIADAQGRAVFTAEGLRRDPVTHDYSLTLPRGSLPAGAYTIRVYALADGKREVTESYAIVVR